MTSRARSMSDSQTLKDDVLANGVGHEGASVRGDSSEKKMSTLSRLLRPWKWRRKKKSKQFVDTSTSKHFILCLGLCSCFRNLYY